jgi:hypothetical protein
MDDSHLAAGVVAYREYEVALAQGGTASMTFTLASRNAESVVSDVARSLQAGAYGFVSILDYPGAPRHPVIWLQLPTQFALMVADGDEDLSPDLKQIIARRLMKFISDIAPIAPELAALHQELG